MITRRTLIRAGMAAPLIFVFAIILLAWGNGAQAVSGSRLLLLSGGHAAWTPLNLPSLVAWWDAQDTAHIALSSSNVTSWTDKKGGIVASQNTGANQPTWSATARNGKPGITFNGGTQFLTFTPTGLPSGSSVGMMSVAAYSNLTNPGNQTFVFAYGASGTTSGQSMLSLQNTNGAVALSTSGGSPVGTTSWNAMDRFQIATVSGTTGTQNVDGNSSETGVVSSPNIQLATGSMGYWAYYGNKWVGTIQQILIGNTVLTTCQRQKLEGWESWYDGKAGSNLPSTHPYKSGPPTTGGAC